MISFKEVKESTVKRIAGVCVDSPEFADIVNEATRKLIRRGDWVGTMSPIQVCVKQGCLVMPRYVQSIRKLSLCNQPLPVGNLWYRFLNYRQCGANWFGSGGRHDGGDPGVLHSNGEACCYSDIVGDGRLLRAYPTVLEDLGKTLTIFGVDNYNQPLRTNNGDGTWSDGWTIVLSTPFGSPDASASPAPLAYIRRIDRVVKEKTQGQVRLFAYDPVNNVQEDLAVYDPGETSPTYTRYSLHANQGHMAGTYSPACCGSVLSIVALIKVRFIPVEFDTDWCMIENLDALKDEIHSIKLREAGDMKGSLELELSAVRELNRELEDQFPDDTFSASNDIFGPGVSFSNRCF